MPTKKEDKKESPVKPIIAVGLGGLMIGALAGGMLGAAKIKLSAQGDMIECSNKLTTATEKLDLKETTIKDLNTELNDVETAIDNCDSDKEGLNNDIDALKSTIDADNKLIDQLNEDLALLQSTSVADEVEACEFSLDLEYGESVGDVELDDRDLVKLSDGEIEFDGDDYDVKEVIGITEDAQVAISGYGFDDEFGAVPYFVTNSKEAVFYKHVFDDKIDYSEIDNDEPLNIKFLGKDMEIVDVDSDAITVRSGLKDSLFEGETKDYNIGGETVTINVKVISDSTEKVKFVINGDETVALEVGDSDKVNGFEILIEEVMTDESGDEPDDVVTFRLSSDEVLETIEDGDYFNEDDKHWKWEITTSDGDLESIGLIYNEVSNSIGDDVEPFTVGGELVLPEGFATIKFAEVEEQEYEGISLSFDEYGDEDTPVLQIEGDILTIDGDEVDEMYFDGETVFYEDEDGEDLEASISDVVVENDDVEFALDFDDGVLSIGEIDIEIGETFEYFGETEEEAEDDEVVYEGTSFGESDYDVLTAEGFVIESPEDSLDDDKLTIKVPSKETKATICVE